MCNPFLCMKSGFLAENSGSCSLRYSRFYCLLKMFCFYVVVVVVYLICKGKCWFGNELLNFSLIKLYVKKNKIESF